MKYRKREKRRRERQKERQRKIQKERQQRDIRGNKIMKYWEANSDLQGLNGALIES